jgi:hypothetical protein
MSRVGLGEVDLHLEHVGRCTRRREGGDVEIVRARLRWIHQYVDRELVTLELGDRLVGGRASGRSIDQERGHGQDERGQCHLDRHRAPEVAGCAARRGGRSTAARCAIALVAGGVGLVTGAAALVRGRRRAASS